jgi:hypothetical protein
VRSINRRHGLLRLFGVVGAAITLGLVFAAAVTSPVMAQTGTIVIQKSLVLPDGSPVMGDLSGYSFTITQSGTMTSVTAGPTNAMGQTPALALPANATYSITEQPRGGATLINFTIGGMSIGAPTGLFMPTSGGMTTITAINQVAGASSIVVTKQIVDANLNVIPTADLSGFVFQLGGPAGFTPQSLTTGVNGQVTFHNLAAGQYSVTEQPRTGYTFVAASRDGTPIQNGQPFFLLANQSMSNLVYQNSTATSGTVRITKELVDTSTPPQVVGGDRSGFQITLTCGFGSSQQTTDLNGSATFMNVPAGPCTINEAPRPGFALVSIVPMGGGNVGNGGTINVPGGQTLEVRVRNTGSAGSVRVIKELVDTSNPPQVIAGDRSGFQFTVACGATSLTSPPTDFNGRATISNVPAGGTCTLTETARAGFEVVSVVPQGGADIGNGGQITVTAGQMLEVRVRNRASMAPTQSVALFPGCNNVPLTWPAGTPVADVAAAIMPQAGLEAIWFYDTPQNRFFGFSPIAPPVANDYNTVRVRLEAVFICMKSSGTLNRPVI